MVFNLISLFPKGYQCAPKLIQGYVRHPGQVRRDNIIRAVAEDPEKSVHRDLN